ncbi:MAG TPA: hypothetical protein VNF07_07880 [Acidimicrobiales bacterium]|nr:hypothetical protein [Acidimicrobiales bacterium]
MIVRILGEGQFELPADAETRLASLDAAVEAAVEASDEAAFHSALDALVGAIKEAGAPLAADRIVPSDLAVPASGASLAEVRELLASEANAGA